MVADFSGKWALDKSENFEAYLDALKLGDELKKKMLEAVPNFEITMDGEKLKVVYANGRTLNLAPGVEFEHDLPNGTKVKGVPKWEGAKLIVTVTPQGTDKTHVTTRELCGAHFVQTFEFGGVSAKRTFKKA